MSKSFLESSVVVGTVRHFLDKSAKIGGTPQDVPVILRAKDANGQPTGNPYVIVNFKPLTSGDESVVPEGVIDMTPGYNLSIFNLESVLKSLTKGCKIAISRSELEYLNNDDSKEDSSDAPSPFDS